MDICVHVKISLSPVRVIPRKINTVTTHALQNWMIFCETVVQMEISIPAKFYFFIAIRFFTADFQSCQKIFWAQAVLGKLA